MKPLSELSREDIKAIKLLCFDADGVTVEKGTGVLEKDGVLTVKTKQIKPELVEKLAKLKKHFHINISSGRTLLYLNQMYEQILWEKASIQGENGLFTLVDGRIVQTDRISPRELEKIERIRREIQKLALMEPNIQGFEPKQFMISVHCVREVPQIHDIVRRWDAEGDFNSFWISDESHDIFLKRFNKGVGLEFLAKYLGLDLSRILGVGNDPNDLPMLEKSGISITTDPEHAAANYRTEQGLDVGGEEVIDRLLEIVV